MWLVMDASLYLLVVLLCFQAAGQETLVRLDDVWRYEGSGADFGTGWREAAFDDSGWAQGRGVLAAEENTVVQPLIQTVLTRVGTNGQYKLIDYFRARFQVPEVRPGYFLSASLLVDDGAVAYLNGSELFRVRMPAGPVTATTLANETIDVGREGVFVTTNVTTSGLQAGENVLAVEVHQPYLTSSDVTWGVVLTYGPMEPLSVSAEPEDKTVAEGKSATLAVGVRGTLPQLQWGKGNQPLAGRTNPVLSLTGITRADAGQYFVTISNEISTVTSRVATLTVILDRTPLRLLDAEYTASGIFVHFSKALAPTSALNPANYRIVTANGDLIPIQTLNPNGPNAVSLRSQTLSPGTNHYVFVSNVEDIYGNRVLSNSGVAILMSYLTNLPIHSVWRYNDAGNMPDAAWAELSFDDSQWPQGAALLYNDVNLTVQPPGVKNTPIAVTNLSGPIVTHYFRLHITNNISPFGAIFETAQYVDDGAVFYLNGRELSRFNMPSGTISPATRASGSATEGIFNSGLTIAPTNFLPGHNVLAAEVHQFSLASPDYPDISFGLQGRVRARSYANVPVAVLQEPQDITVREGEEAEFNAEVAAAESVQWLRDGVPIPGANSMTFKTRDFAGGFGLLASNSFGAATTRTARLTVIADRSAPRLLSADMGTNVNRLVLTFNEGIDPSSLALENFVVTNAAGGGLDVLGVNVLSATNIVLTTSPRSTGGRYILSVKNLRDTSLGKNLLSEGSIGIGYEDVLVNYDSTWKYEDTGTNYTTVWRDPSYNDDAWPSGPGLLGFETASVLPVPIRTTLPPPEFRGPTYFFRTRFNFSGDPASTLLRLRHIVDDGIVLYLNGQEVHRARVPVGQNAGTIADSMIPDGTIEGPFTISSAPLVNGDNVLAAEVHQVNIISEDSVFGLELTRAFLPEPYGPTPPRLDFEWREGQLLLWWDAWDFVLESTTELSGPWRLVAQPTIPYSVSANDSARFFRLKKDF